MDFTAEHLVFNKRSLSVLLVSLCFVTGLLLAYQPILSIICFLIIALSILLPLSWLTWLVIVIAPLQLTVIELQNIPYLEDIPYLGDIPYKISYFDVAALLLIINFALNGVFRKFSRFERQLSYLLLLFCLVGIVSLSRAAYPLTGIYYLARLGALFVIFLSAIYYVREHRLEQSLSALYICLWLIVTIGIINAFQSPEDLRSTVIVLFKDPEAVERAGSIYNQPNITGHTIGFFLPICLGFALLPGQRRIIQLLQITTTIFLGFLLILTGSRGGVITAATGLLILTLYVGRFSLRLIPLILLGFFIFNWAFMREFFFDVRSLSIENRINLIYYGLKTALEHPIAGIGLRQFNTHFHNMPFYLAGRSSHNAYLEILVEMGILGFGVFITFIVFVWKELINTPEQKKQFTTVLRGIALSSFASLLCSKLFMGGLVLATWWIALAFILGFIQRFSRSSF